VSRPDESNLSGAVAFVLKGYPRLSETFIAEEILSLEQAGMDLRIISLRHPTDGKIHPVHRAIRAPLSYLPEYLHREPLRVLRGIWRVRVRPGFAAALRQFAADLRRDVSRNRLRRFGQACVLAAELPDDVARLHAHFIHTPASVTAYAALITGLPWSCSAHAKDIWTSPAWELAQKLRAALFTVTCTAAGQARLHAAASDRPVALVHHGLRLDRFSPLVYAPAARDGSDLSSPVRILSVGRAVEKKGFDLLIAALARLPPELAWRWTHIGGGPLRGTLEAQAAAIGVADRVAWRGAQDQDAVLAAYRAADLFVLPCRVAADGDRDGLPNVLVEAQSQSLACLSTDVSGVTELVQHARTGVIVPPDDVEALAAALLQLIRDPALRSRLGRAGAQHVHACFDARRSTAKLLDLFGVGRRADAA
jgi:glycosyltransferase involved in cell wall biosynthesis